jgi:predicted  nucleic acid-binding Zn-ribbon protein
MLSSSRRSEGERAMTNGDTIDDRLNRLAQKVDAGFAAASERFDANDREFEAIDRRFEAIDLRFDAVERRLDRLEVTVDDIRDQVGHIAEGHAATQALIHRKFDELVARFDRRVEPLELAVRHHSRVVENHRLTEGSGG